MMKANEKRDKQMEDMLAAMSALTNSTANTNVCVLPLTTNKNMDVINMSTPPIDSHLYQESKETSPLDYTQDIRHKDVALQRADQQ